MKKYYLRNYIAKCYAHYLITEMETKQAVQIKLYANHLIDINKENIINGCL